MREGRGAQAEAGDFKRKYALIQRLLRYSINARLFSCGVEAGRPKSPREPMAHFTSKKLSSRSPCILARAHSSSGKVFAVSAVG